MGTLNGLFGMPEQDDGGLLGAIGSLLGGSKLTAEQQRGMRAATSRILEASGPSRTPRTFMQALGSGMGAFDDGVQSARDHAVLEQQRTLQQQLLGLKLKDAEADFGHQQGEREKQIRIADRIRKLYEVGGLDLGSVQGGVPGSAPDFGGDLGSTPAFTPDPRLGLGGMPGGLGTVPGLSANAPGAPQNADAFRSPFMQHMDALGSSAPRAGKYGAQAYYDAAQQAGLPSPGSIETSNQIIDRVNRLGETPQAAARALSGKGAGASQGTPQSSGVDPFKLGLPPMSALSMMQGGRGRPNMTQQTVERMMAEAEIYASEGDFDKAEKRYKAVSGLMPQVDRIDIATDPNTKQPVRVITFKDGTEQVSAFGAKRDMVDIDLGNVRKFVDRNQVQPGEEYRKGQSPDSAAADARWAARGTGRSGSGGGGEASLDPDTLDMMADQALRGDRSVFQNIGRGAQGSANLVALRGRITQKAKALGLTGADLAATTADYGGLVAGLRTSANISARVENAISEARELAPLAITAGQNVSRAGLLPFGKAQVMFDTQTNNPELKKFAAANVGFVQAYAGAMARGQKPTVHDKEHAEKLISEATSQKAYEAVMGQLMLEMDAASKAPQNVREHLRKEIGGRGSEHGGDQGGGPPKTVDMLPNAAKAKGRRYKADNGTIYRSDGTKWIKE